MLEREIIQDTSKRLRILNTNLSGNDMTCRVNLMGVMHDGQPGKEIMDSLHHADVITLELTRRVVEAGLHSEDSQLLNRNSFWKTIIEDLKRVEGKIVRGIEINQTPRIAWKRFSLFMGDATLAASDLTFVVYPNCPVLDGLVDKETAENVRLKNWAVSEDEQTVDNIIDLTNNAVDSGTGKGMPLQVAQGMSLICLNTENRSKDNPVSITLITPPHPSVTKTYDQVRQTLKAFNLFNEEEIEFFGSSIIMNYLLTLPELTDVREIAYFANQYVKQNVAKGRNFDVLHVGGSYHVPVMASIFGDLLPDNPLIEVRQSYDQRVPLANSLYILYAFPLEFIPYRDRVAGLKIENNDVVMQPEFVSRQVETAIQDHYHELRARLEKCRNER